MSDTNQVLQIRDMLKCLASDTECISVFDQYGLLALSAGDETRNAATIFACSEHSAEPPRDISFTLEGRASIRARTRKSLRVWITQFI
jgi:hypothetical protein